MKGQRRQALPRNVTYSRFTLHYHFTFAKASTSDILRMSFPAFPDPSGYLRDCCKEVLGMISR